MGFREQLAEGITARPERQPVALFIYIVAAVGVLGVSFVSPILPVMMEALSLTDAQSGLLITVYTAPVVAFVPLFGWLSDRVGRRPVIAFGLVLFGAAGATIFLTTSFETILVLRVVQGVGFSAMMPLTTALLGDLFEGKAEVGAQGLRVTFISLGSAIYPVLGGTLAEIDWRLPFLLFAAAIPLGVVVFAFLPNVAAQTTTEDREESYLRSVLSGARDPLVASALGVGFVRFFVRYGMWAYLPLLAAQRSLPAGEVGLVIGSVGAAKMVLASQSRRVLAIGSPSMVMAGGLLVGSLLAAVMSVPATLPAFLVLGLAFGAIDGVVAPLQKSLMTQRVSADVRGGVVSANNVLQNAGKTLGPAVLGVLTAVLSLAELLVVAGAVGAVTGLVVLAGVRRYQRGVGSTEPDIRSG
ncbi:MAG: MFS transporter [Haloarculaceae archaeon]